MYKFIFKEGFGVEVEGTFLTPLEFSDTCKGSSYFIFRCSLCGNKKRIRGHNVTNNNPKFKTKSCGCLLEKQKKKFAEEHKHDRKGKTPWNKGKSGYKVSKPKKPNWKRGKVMLKYPNGSIKWVKVSDKAIGSYHPWYERPTRSKKSTQSSP